MLSLSYIRHATDEEILNIRNKEKHSNLVLAVHDIAWSSKSIEQLESVIKLVSENDEG